MQKLDLYKTQALLWAFFLLIIFSLPGKALYSLGPERTNWNLLSPMFHLLGYLIFAFLVFRALAYEKNAMLYTLLLCFSYGFFTECIQLLVPGRYFLISDIFVNYVGSIFGIFIYKTLPDFITSQ